MIKKDIFLIFIGILMLAGCEDLLTPAPENFKDVEQMYTDSKYAQGFLVNVYRTIPGYYDNSEYATDDAVTNQTSNNFLRIATGAWTASNNPLNRWNGSYGAIQYLNLFLENVDKVKWADDEEPSNLFAIRMKGEAFGMRALSMYYLLRAHSGFTEDGQLLGVPILNEHLTVNSEFNIPRSTFKECVDQIFEDLDSAMVYLPLEYKNINDDNEIPAHIRTITQRKEVYNRVMGEPARQLFNGLIAQSFRARTALLAASPAFQDSSNPNNWADAANAAALIIDYLGGINGIDPNGVTYYANTAEIDGLGQGVNPREIIWRENIATNNTTQEEQNFPPTLFGTGFMNPSQNLVDAFPMANGYPINHPESGYNETNPYANRDPRLSKYIIYNGSTAGVSNTVIHTGRSAGEDGINFKETSTRTGYYMKKRLRMDVNVNPSSTTGKIHYNPRIRATEIYLTYAEAANEAWGPTGDGGHTYSAYDIIKAIRNRAGIGGVVIGDSYLESIKNDKDAMRTLIRNERRLELSFESFRFWDLRRWKASLNETVYGMDPSSNYSSFPVEERSYEDYMYYGPIPYSEILKYDNLIQNRGWK